MQEWPNMIMQVIAAMAVLLAAFIIVAALIGL
jgi:hypothetical protein